MDGSTLKPKSDLELQLEDANRRNSLLFRRIEELLAENARLRELAKEVFELYAVR